MVSTCDNCRYTSAGKRLQAVLPEASPIVSEALCVTGRGCELFDLVCARDLEGVVGKRAGDPYEPRTRWLKVKNRDYSQAEGRGDLFNGRQRHATATLKSPPRQ